MKTWILKALAQKFISFLPYSYQINSFFQKHVTRGLILNEALLEDKLIHARNHLSYYHKFGQPQNSFNVLEVGTGWFPVIPVCMFLCGADTIVTCDVKPLLSKKRTLTTISEILEMANQERLNQYITGIDEHRLSMLKEIREKSHSISFSEILDLLNLKILAGDIREIDLDDQFADLIVSNNTLEHIRSGYIRDIIRKLVHAARKNGIMSHFIDMSDHFAHMDPTIPILHFLKFTDRQWFFINNSIQPMNRERIGFYRSIFKDLNLSIIHEENRYITSGEVERISLAERFRELPEEELRISHSHMVLILN